MSPAFLRRPRWWNHLACACFFGVIVLGLLFIPFWCLWCVLTKNRTGFTRINYWFFGLVFPLFGIRVKVEGKEYLQGSSFVILANHQSFLHIPALLQAVMPSAYLAKKSLFDIPYFGQFLHYTGSIPVDRKNPRLNDRIPALLRERLSQGFTFTVFPEGTRSVDGSLLPFKNGIFRMIKAAPVPVLPVTLVGTGRILPKEGFALFRGELRIVIHAPISPEEIEGMDLEQFRDRVKSAIQGSLPGYTEN